ncbi:hypothetical protein BASA50_008252 [Batrachochytrium salamandrivorans]|uniref:Rhamnolipids biosynthesis 3-oxoacyl-[acyl-carrier-protein] reductase n=1 Tax=Batrachochytrium salamandrivorans TaxID=1357716 RepID=A0ABQ8F4L9_9FUNG|nr:hypothetical protein BASA60_009512 [Batrachochytrium salamandrivorans]KAH6570380.1 hypothetical protein BASA62_004373 [Batrachochytrium salamandrivorans]KAH6592106.1 hypothetical protein BASA50_008252 [Batrachochytrium salamandrivorans]KAH6592509.1 hypothetical protein BASA61_004533 [Batrachochytrium salamandrivorans]KAH6599800.1 hypothetical protein BASA61_002461 [Batrachochytrium salamandrivorans]
MEGFDLQSLFNVKGKVALVTGGGAGIGKVMAAALVQNGAKVYIASRNLKTVQATAAELTLAGPGTCIAIQADLSNKAQAEALASQIAAKEPKLHILINNSGLAWGASLSDFDEKNGWDQLMAVNVKAVFYLTASLVPLLKAGANGNLEPSRVINISSIAGTASSAQGPLSRPNSGTWSYAASKAAVNQLTRVLATTLANDMITVNAIAPGIFPSGMTKFGISKAKTLMEEMQPLGRIGIPHDIAGIVLFLSSPASAHITGVVIPIDGGASLGYTALSRL